MYSFNFPQRNVIMTTMWCKWYQNSETKASNILMEHCFTTWEYLIEIYSLSFRKSFSYEFGFIPYPSTFDCFWLLLKDPFLRLWSTYNYPGLIYTQWEQFLNGNDPFLSAAYSFKVGSWFSTTPQLPQLVQKRRCLPQQIPMLDLWFLLS